MCDVPFECKVKAGSVHARADHGGVAFALADRVVVAPAGDDESRSSVRRPVRVVALSLLLLLPLVERKPRGEGVLVESIAAPASDDGWRSSTTQSGSWSI